MFRSRDVRFEQEKLFSTKSLTSEIPASLDPLSADDNSNRLMKSHVDNNEIDRCLRFQDCVMNVESTHYLQEQESFAGAADSNQHGKWLEAMKSEIRSLNENDTRTLEHLPECCKALPCKWVYKVKQYLDGSVERYKAGLVIKGCSQRQGIDYGETFSSVVRSSSIRAVLSFAASQKMVLAQFDVSTAFLYGELEEEIYMHQPEGFDDGSGRVCRLKRSLYGLKQAPRCWNKRFGNFLRQLGFQQNKADPCIFMRVRGNEIIIALYVDDGQMVATSEAEIKQLVADLESEFKVTAKEASYFLGL